MPPDVHIIFIFYRAVSCLAIGPIGTLIENHSVRNCEVQGLSYGMVKACGCIATTVGSFICTPVLQKVELKYAFWIASALMILPLIFTIFSNDPKVEKKEKPRGSASDVKALFGNYYFATFLIFTALFYLAQNAVMIFAPFLMAEIGVDTTYYGTFLSLRTLTSIPFLFIFGWIRKRMKLKSIIILASLFMSAESLMLGLIGKDLTTMLISAAVFGIGNGLQLGVISLYIYKLSPDSLKAIAHSLHGAILLGVGIIGNLFGGVVYEWLGGSAFFTLIGLVMLFAALFFIGTLLFGYAKRIPNPADEAA